APHLYATLSDATLALPSFPTRRSSDLKTRATIQKRKVVGAAGRAAGGSGDEPGFEWAGVGGGAADEDRVVQNGYGPAAIPTAKRSEEHTSELQSREKLVCRLRLEKKKR